MDYLYCYGPRGVFCSWQVNTASGLVGAIRQEAIIWANVDPHLCHHMASLGHNKLNEVVWCFDIMESMSMVMNMQYIVFEKLDDSDDGYTSQIPICHLSFNINKTTIWET